MPSSYTASLRIELQGQFENDTTWGTKANTSFELLEKAIAGYVSVSHPDSASYTLTSLNAADDEARNMYIKVTGALSANRNVICPTAEKLFFVENSTSGGFSIIFKTSGGTGVTIPNGKSRVVMCDGTNVIDAINDLPASTTLAGVEIVTLTGTQTLTNKTITISDSNFSVVDNSDATKIAKFECSSISTGTTRTFTLPNASDTLVVTNGAQTLANKTLANTTTATFLDNLLTLQDNVDNTKQAQFQLSGITTATTRTYTMPDANTTLVGTDAAQTLTNKTITIADNALTVQDNSDATKQLQLQLSGITTGTTRTLTVPDANTTIVGTDATQTLTNKTINILDSNLTIQDNGDATKQVQFQASGITTGTTRTITIPDSNGTMLTTANGRSQGKETIWMPASAMAVPTTNGAAAGTTIGTNVVYRTLDFDQTTSESAQFQIAMPKSWNLGTLTFISYWTAASGTGTVTFTMQAQAISNDDVLDTAFSGGVSVTDTLIATGDVHVADESTGLTVTGTPAAGDLVAFKILRDISDSLNADAKLIGVRIIYTTNAADDS